jgi:hypothetical protein
MTDGTLEFKLHNAANGNRRGASQFRPVFGVTVAGAAIGALMGTLLGAEGTTVGAVVGGLLGHKAARLLYPTTDDVHLRQQYWGRP